MAIYTLKADGSGTVGGGGVTELTAAVDAAADNDVIHVYPGTYYESDTTRLNTGGNEVDIVLPEPGEVRLDYNGNNPVSLVYSDTAGTRTISGHKDAKLILYNFAEGASLTKGFTIGSAGTLKIKDIQTIIYNTHGIQTRALVAQVGAGTLDVERLATFRCDGIMNDFGGASIIAKGCFFNQGAYGIRSTKIGGSETKLYNCTFAGYETWLVDSDEADVVMELYNCLIVGGYAAIDQPTDNIVLKNCRVTYIVTGSGIDGDTTIDDQGGNLIDSAFVPTTNIDNFDAGGMLSFTTDDSQNFDDGWPEMTSALEKHGLKGVLAVDFTQTRGAAFWDSVRKDFKKGHEISCHTRNGTNMSTLNAFAIQYNGAATTATVSITPTQVTTQLDGAGTDQTWLASDYASSEDLVTAINGTTDYRARTFVGDNVGDATLDYGTGATDRAQTGEGRTSTLATVTDQDIKLGGNVSYEAQYDSALFFNEEITNMVADVNKFLPDLNMDVGTLVFPFLYQSDTHNAAIEANGMIVNRASGEDIFYWGDGTYPEANNFGYRSSSAGSYAVDTLVSGQTEAVIKGRGSMLALLTRYTGACMHCYGHTDPTYQEYEYFIDSIVAAGGKIGTMNDISRFTIREKNPQRVVDTNRVAYIHQDMEDMITLISNYELNPDSELAEAGSDEGIGQFRGMNGEPFSLTNPPIGCSQPVKMGLNPENIK